MSRGKLIVLEGPDGSGKTTLAYKIEGYIQYHINMVLVIKR